MTDAHVIRFKSYFAKATGESKSDLDKLYKRPWATFTRHHSMDRGPMHDWCDPQWYKYLQSKLNDRPYYHNSKSNIAYPGDLIRRPDRHRI